jgi:SAM-dependent methyltransferase
MIAAQLNLTPENGEAGRAEDIRCPITGLVGALRRTRHGGELFSAYGTYLGHALPEHFKAQYFQAAISEYECAESGLRWYLPSPLGDESFYDTLSQIFPWYYGSKGWDKAELLDHLRAARPECVVEVGCGEGETLQQVAALGIEAHGIDLNTAAILRARARGLAAFTLHEKPTILKPVQVLYMLQTIEHVADPVGVLKAYVTQFRPEKIILSAPCFEGLLGYTSDPLVWPPHHATCWSERGFATLAERVGYRLEKVLRTPLTYPEFRGNVARESTGRLSGVPVLCHGVLGRMAFAWHRLRRKSWALYGHSIMVQMKRTGETR